MVNCKYTTLPLLFVALTIVTEYVCGSSYYSSIECGNSWQNQYCINGSTLTINDNNFTIADNTVVTLNTEHNITCNFTHSYEYNNLKCTLNIPTSVPNGPYEIQIILTDANEAVIPAGTIITGQINGDSISTWYNGTPVLNGIEVESQSTDTLENNTNFMIKGKFDKNATYEITFYAFKSSESNYPKCVNPTVTTDNIVCNLRVDMSMKSTYSFLVHDKDKNEYVTMSQQLRPLHVKRVKPILTSIKCSGSDSDFCVNGSIVTFNGEKMDTFKENSIIVLNEEHGIKCEIERELEFYIECYLKLTTPVIDGPYPLLVNVSDDDEIHLQAGNLLIGEFNGGKITVWNNATAPAEGLIVQEESTQQLKNNSDFVVQGKFDKDRSYNILFFSTSSTSKPIPSCSKTVTTDSSISCKVNTTSKMLDTYKFLVQDTETTVFLPMSKNFSNLYVTLSSPIITTASGDCAINSSACLSGSYLILNGTNFNDNNKWYNKIVIANRFDSIERVQCNNVKVTATTVMCKLSIEQNAFSGQYAITFIGQVNIKQDKSDIVKAGYLNLGAGKSRTGWESNLTPALNNHISQILPEQIQSGTIVTISGQFSKQGNYEVLFSRANLSSSLLPNETLSCNLISISATAVTCVYVSQLNTTGTWFANVHDTDSNLYIPFDWSTANSVTIIAANPEVTGARGECVKDSTACISGAYLTFIGNYFNTDSPDNNKLSFVNADSGLQCHMKSVDTSYITCELSVPAHLTGAYNIELSVKLSNNSWLTPAVPAGVLVLGADSQTAGWKMSQDNDIISHNTSSGLTPLMKVSIVLIVCFAICLIVLSSIFVYVCCKYHFIRKARATHAESAHFNEQHEPTNGLREHHKSIDDYNQYFGEGRVINS